jgi:hypothetical protein
VLRGGLKFLETVHQSVIVEVVHAGEIESIFSRYGYRSDTLFGTYCLFS